MKEIPSKEGPYPVRLVYEPDEIDQICEDALRSVKLLPSEPQAIQVDRFLEKYFEVEVVYEEIGKGILGSTVFNSRGAVTGFLISPKIEEDGTEAGERRARSTIAHEGGHGLLHSRLFIIDPTPSLFGDSTRSKDSNFLCREGDIGAAGSKGGYDGRWWEWQANRAIGGLLLPKRLVRKVAAGYLEEGKLGPELPQEKRTALEREVAALFDVNRIVARFRVEEIFPLEKNQKFLH